MKKLIFLFLLAHSSLFYAQTTGNVQGRITDSTQQRNVEFVSVAVLSAVDSAIVQGTLTDSLGQFLISNLPEGTYFLVASSVEYQKWVSPEWTIAPTTPSVNLGIIALKTDEKSLSEIVITSNKPVFQQRMGNVIVNVDSKMFKTAVNALEVMRRSPGLQVDVSGKITFRGTSPKILIDGRDLRMTPEQEKNYLRALTPAQIETIELMPNPPAKYESAFLTVINIKLKRDQNLGLRGTVYGSYLYNGLPNGDLGGNLTFKTPKMAYSLNIGAAQNTWYERINDRRIMGTNTPRDQFVSLIDLKMPNRSLNVVGGVEYTIDKKNSVDFKLTTDFTRSPGSIYTENNSSLAGVEQPFVRSTNDMNETGQSITGLLGYRYKSDNRELIIEVAAANNNRPATQDLITEYWRGEQPARGIFRQRNNQLAAASFQTLNVSFSDVVFKNWQFETGFKVNRVQNIARIDFDTLLLANATRQTPMTDADFGKDFRRSNAFNFDENINMFFVQMSRQYKKLGITAGMRTENTITEGESETTQSLVNRNYWNWLPTLTFQYKLGESSNLVWATSRKISRPGVWQLNPFPFFADPFTIALGDPFLLPRVRTASELSYTYKNFMVIGGYNHYQNSTVQLPLYNQTTRLTTWQQVNTDGQRFFFDISHSAQIMPKWSYQIYLSSAYSEEQLTLNNKLNKAGGFTASAWATNIFNLPKGYNLEVSGWFTPANQSGLFRTKAMGAVNLAVQKSFLKDKLNLQINVNDIFWTSNNRGSVLIEGSDMTIENRQPNRNGSVRLTYNFGKSTFQAQRRKSGVGEDAARIRK